jgi:hypothetical protein
VFGSARHAPPITIDVFVRVFLLAGTSGKLFKLLRAQAIQKSSQRWLEFTLREALDAIQSPLLDLILHEAHLSQGIYELCVEVRIVDFSDLREKNGMQSRERSDALGCCGGNGPATRTGCSPVIL